MIIPKREGYSTDCKEMSLTIDCREGCGFYTMLGGDEYCGARLQFRKLIEKKGKSKPCILESRRRNWRGEANYPNAYAKRLIGNYLIIYNSFCGIGIKNDSNMD